MVKQFDDRRRLESAGRKVELPSLMIISESTCVMGLGVKMDNGCQYIDYFAVNNCILFQAYP